ncbi:MAG: phospho-N-acetylmuramoyl-pentapeptide-transferase [Actinobacteria bacterium]|nr:phospho-N-acetylmuramoyl-pentapeptide-transferase [Actinomycetota bacterium]
MRLVLIAAGLGLFVSLLGTPLLIRFLRRHHLAQAIRVSTDDEPYPEHSGKMGTPSMGGLAILAGLLIGYFGAHIAAWRPPSWSGMLAIYLTVGLGCVGIADDYLKIFKQRSTGVRARTKLLGQAAVAISFAFLSLMFPDSDGRTPASRAVSLFRDTGLVLPTALFVLWIWFLVTATTNGVNLTDGLDGLAAGASVMTLGAYTLLSVWQYGQNCQFGEFARCYDVRDPLDLAIFAAAAAGACFGFLWWNTSPASIFMGDTGSLSLGGAIAALAILSRTELLLALLAGLFVIVTLSVIGQVGSYKLTGRRMFRMAPLHHHFEMLGWAEVQIVVRFWIIQGLFVSLGLAIFYAEWVRQ